MNEKTIDDLKGNPSNPRSISKPDFASLKQSIVKFGDLSGVVLNIRTGQLVGGHQRVEAFKALSADKRIEVTQRYDQATTKGTVAIGYVMLQGERYGYREVDWDPTFELAANIAANRIQGQFDTDLLAEVTYQIQQESPELLELTGQTLDEINKLLDMVGVNTGEDEDDVPGLESDQPIVSKVGEVYQLGKHRLMCGSSTDQNHVNTLLGGASIDLVYTDPPYGIDIVGDNGQVGASNLAQNQVYAKVEGDGDIKTADDFYKLCDRLGMTKFIMWGGNYFTGFLPFSDGWLIWDKRGDMNGNNFADGEMAWCSFHTPVRIYKQVWNGMIREGEKESRVRPTQKPVKMLADILQDFSKRGEKVYDGFGGSGATLMACEKMGRDCFMMELSPAYVDIVRKRYAKSLGHEDDWEAMTPLVGQADASINQEPAAADDFAPPTLPDM